jgi:hypothetical protein
VCSSNVRVFSIIEGANIEIDKKRKTDAFL